MGKPESAMHTRERNPTSKIWAVFLVSLATTAGAFYWSYTNFRTLSTSLEALTRPGAEADLIGEVFQEIIQAENHIHSYMLTGDTTARSQYRRRIATARNNISLLRGLLQDDTVQLQRVDTLKSILDLKINYLERFLHIKRLKQSSLFTSEAMNRIAEEMNDTAFIDKQLTKREIIKGETIPVEKEKIVITPDEFKGVNGFLRKLFGRDQTRIDTFRTMESETSYTFDVAIDTSIVRDYFMDSTLLAVKDILSLVMRKEMYLQERLTETEMKLMQQNKVFIANIRMVIEKLRERELSVAAVNRKAARDLVDGSIFVLLLIGCAGALMSGVFIFLILRDITRAYHYRRQLEREKSKAESLARVKEEFLSNMSHEIRTPLHNILGFSSLLEKTSLDGKQREYMMAIRESHHYLSGLVNSILDQAKINAGKLQLAAERFDPVRLVREVIASHSHAAVSKDLTLDTEITGQVHDVHLTGDTFRIKQILHNLVSNAIKFTDKGSITVVLGGEEKADSFDLRITVTDTGIGIQEEKLAVIFEPFEQAASGLKHVSGGTGLGLSITRSLVQAMSGTITAENHPRGGAVFRVSVLLPYSPALPSVEDATQAERKEAVYADRRIVVVEDDRWNAVLLEEILRPRVGHVHVFHDGRDALAFMKQSPVWPDLVFTDINLPVLGGEALMDALKAHRADMPVVAVTAHIQGEKFNRLRDSGFDDVCKKPFSRDEIENILDRYLGEPDAAERSPDTRFTHDFDFSPIRAFAGDDEVLYARLVNELVDNNALDVQSFRAHLSAGRAKELGYLSHRMKTMYETLKLFNVAESLASIELHERLGNRERLLEIAGELYPDLKAVCEQLVDFRRRYHIV